jgi:hypothetical protein
MCFSLAWLQQLVVYIIVISAIVALLKLLIPWALQFLGAEGGIVVQALNIILWTVVAILVVYIVFALIACLLGVSSLPLLPHR